MSFLYAEFLTKPVWMWLAFLGIVVALLAFDLGVLHRKTKVIGVGESLADFVTLIQLPLPKQYPGQSRQMNIQILRTKIRLGFSGAGHFSNRPRTQRRHS